MTDLLLPKNLQKSLYQIVERVNRSSNDGAIRAILLSTTEGVSLGRIVARPSDGVDGGTSSSSSDNNLNEAVLASLETTWAPASKQCSSLLNMGKDVKIVTAIYDHGTVLHVYQTPVVVTILVSVHANIGVVRSIGVPLLQAALEPLCTTLLNSLTPPPQESAVY